MSGSHLCIPRNKTVISKTELQCSVSKILHSYIRERFIYFQDRSAYSAAGKYVNRSWQYINLSHTGTHKGGSWDWGRAIPRKGIHKLDFHPKLFKSTLQYIYNEIFSVSLELTGHRFSFSKSFPDSQILFLLRTQLLPICTIFALLFIRKSAKTCPM